MAFGADAGVTMRVLALLNPHDRGVLLRSSTTVRETVAVFVALEFVRGLRVRSHREGGDLWHSYLPDDPFLKELIECLRAMRVRPDQLLQEPSKQLEQLLVEAAGSCTSVWIPCLESPSHRWILSLLRPSDLTSPYWPYEFLASEEETTACCTTVVIRGVSFHFMHNLAADVNAPNGKGAPPIFCAARHGHLDCLRFLCDVCGADVDGVDGDGWSAAHIAASYGQVESLKFLCDRGAKLDLKNCFGRSPAALAQKFSQHAAFDFLHDAPERVAA